MERAPTTGSLRAPAPPATEESTAIVNVAEPEVECQDRTDLNVTLQSVFAQLEVAMKPLAGRASSATDSDPEQSQHAGMYREPKPATVQVSKAPKSLPFIAASAPSVRPPSSLQQALLQRQQHKQAATPWDATGVTAVARNVAASASIPTPRPTVVQQQQPQPDPASPAALFELPPLLAASGGDPGLSGRINARTEPLAAEGRRLVELLLRGVRVSVSSRVPSHPSRAAVLSLLPDLRGLLLREGLGEQQRQQQLQRVSAAPPSFAGATPADDTVLAAVPLDDLAAVWVSDAKPGLFELRRRGASPPLELTAADGLSRLDIVACLALVHGLLPGA